MQDKFALVVDDLPDNRILFQSILESVGVKVLTSANGREGVDLVKARLATGQPVDIVFLDMMMPELGGVGAAKEMRSLGYAGPILAFSADVTSRTSRMAKEAGVNHYFVKTSFNRSLAQALLERFCDLEVGA